MNLSKRAVCCLGAFALFAATLDCNRKLERTRLEKQPPVAAVHAVLRTSASAPIPPPTQAEVRQTILRIFDHVVQMQEGASPSYLVGDFNGDGIQDLAVVVRPAPGKVVQLNAEVANWILEDPGQVFVPDPSRRVQAFPPPPVPPRVKPGSTLVAIVHGYGERGWREPAARQSYLLLNVASNGLDGEGKEHALRGSSRQSMPRLFGDIIRTKYEGRVGFLYWTGGHYAWHSL